MSTLSTLKLVAAKKPSAITPIVQRRNKIIARLWEQQKLAESQGTGTPYAPLKTKRMKDIEGNIKYIEAPKRIKPWWFTSDTGAICLAIKYGNTVIEIAKGKTAIELNNLLELSQVLSQIASLTSFGMTICHFGQTVTLP